MLAHGAHPQSERGAIQHPRHKRDADDTDPHQRIVRQRNEARAAALEFEARHAWRVGRAVEDQPQEESRESNGEEIDCDADDDLIGLEANGARGIQHRQQSATENRGEHAGPRRPGEITADRRAERAAQHVALERESDESGPLAEYAARRRQHVRDGDAQRLRQKVERVHASDLRRAPRRSRRTSGTEVATAIMTTACSTSTICLGTSAFTAKPPCDSVAKSSAAMTMPTG